MSTGWPTRMLVPLLIVAAGCASGRPVDPPAQDGSVDGGPRDAGHDGSTPDAGDGGDGGDAGDAAVPGAHTCDFARCPVPRTRLAVAWLVQPVAGAACCTGDPRWDPDPGEPSVCGVRVPDERDDERCMPIVEGTRDERCLDTVVSGRVLEGCLRPDGYCGHDDGEWGCHRVHRTRWDWDLRTPDDDDQSGLPNPFVCTQHGQPCTRTRECCFHDNYGAECTFDDADAGSAMGVCTLGPYE